MKFILKYLIVMTFLLLVCPSQGGMAQEERIDNSDYEAASYEVGQEIRICAETVNRVDRLLCYDDVAKSLGFIAPDRAEREEIILEKVGFWEAAQKRNAAGELIIYLRNNSIEPVVSMSGTTRYPQLIITCKHGQTEVYIDWKKRITFTRHTHVMMYPIVYQFDALERIGDTWELSTDRQALFAPDAVNFVKQLRQHNKFIYEMTPYGDSVHVVVHDISGLNTVLKILVEKCYNT